MKVRPVHVLGLIPVGLVLATLGVWVWRTYGPQPAEPAGPGVEVRTAEAAGVRFEVEYRAGTARDATAGPDTVDFRRGPDFLDFADGVLVVNGVGFPEVKPGDVVRWNLEGPLLVNGRPVRPHPLQPRRLLVPAADPRWEPRGGPAPRDTLSVDWSRDGRLLVMANGDGAVRVWDAEKQEVRHTLVPDPPKDGGRGPWALRAAISPDGKTVAVTNVHAPDVTLWDAATGNKLATLSQPAARVTAVQFLADDWLLESRGGTLHARHLAGDRSKVVELGKVHDDLPPPFAVSADGTTLARNDGQAVTVSRLTRAGDTVTATPAGPVAAKVSRGGAAALSADGALVAVFDGDARLAVYDPRTGAQKHRLRWRHDRPGEAVQVEAMAFTPDGAMLAVGEKESLRLYDVATGRERGWVEAAWVRSLAFSADGKTLAAGLRYLPGVRLWETAKLVDGP